MTGPSDISLLEQLKALDKEVREMLSADLPEQVDLVTRQLRKGEIDAARDTVHTVRGSAAFCRLDSLRDSAAALEQALDEKDAPDRLLETFERSCREVLQQLELIDEQGNHQGD